MMESEKYSNIRKHIKKQLLTLRKDTDEISIEDVNKMLIKYFEEENFFIRIMCDEEHLFNLTGTSMTVDDAFTLLDDNSFRSTKFTPDDVQQLNHREISLEELATKLQDYEVELLNAKKNLMLKIYYILKEKDEITLGLTHGLLLSFVSNRISIFNDIVGDIKTFTNSEKRMFNRYPYAFLVSIYDDLLVSK